MSVATLARPDAAGSVGVGARRRGVLVAGGRSCRCCSSAVFFAWPVAVMIAQGFVVDGQLDLSGFADVFSRPAHVADRRADARAGDPGDRAARAARRARRVRAVPALVPRARAACGRSSPCRSCCRRSSSASRSGRCWSSGGPLGFLHLDGTFAAIVAALVFFNYAVVVRTVGGLWERLDPRAEQAARALGASPWRAFRTVTLPALTPGDRVGGVARVPVLRDRVRHRARARRPAVRHHRDRDLDPDDAVPRPARRRGAVRRAARRRRGRRSSSPAVPGRAGSARSADPAVAPPSGRCGCAGPPACRPATGTRSPSSRPP